MARRAPPYAVRFLSTALALLVFSAFAGANFLLGLLAARSNGTASSQNPFAKLLTPGAEAFPTLSPAHRESIMTGCTDEEWQKLFGNNEEEENDGLPADLVVISATDFQHNPAARRATFLPLR